MASTQIGGVAILHEGPGGGEGHAGTGGEGRFNVAGVDGIRSDRRR